MGLVKAGERVMDKREWRRRQTGVEFDIGHDCGGYTREKGGEALGVAGVDRVHGRRGGILPYALQREILCQGAPPHPPVDDMGGDIFATAMHEQAGPQFRFQQQDTARTPLFQGFTHNSGDIERKIGCMQDDVARERGGADNLQSFPGAAGDQNMAGMCRCEIV